MRHFPRLWCDPYPLHAHDYLSVLLLVRCLVRIGCMYAWRVICDIFKFDDGTHLQGLNTTQVRHHTHPDLSTCGVGFVNHMMTMRHFPRLWCDPYPLHAHGLDLCSFFSALVCDLPRGSQDSCFMVRQRRIAEEYLSHNFDEHCLEDNRLIWCLSYPTGGQCF